MYKHPQTLHIKSCQLGSQTTSWEVVRGNFATSYLWLKGTTQKLVVVDQQPAPNTIRHTHPPKLPQIIFQNFSSCKKCPQCCTLRVYASKILYTQQQIKYNTFCICIFFHGKWNSHCIAKEKFHGIQTVMIIRKREEDVGGIPSVSFLSDTLGVYAKDSYFWYWAGLFHCNIYSNIPNGNYRYQWLKPLWPGFNLITLFNYRYIYYIVPTCSYM